MRIIVIHDSIVTSVAQDVKLIPNAETYTFMPISAFAVFLGFWGSMPDAEKPFQLDFELPNHMPYREGCLPPEVDEFLTHQWSLMGSESGRLYNTSRWVEGRYLQLLEKLIDNSDIKHFAIGPINPVQVKNSCSSEKQKHRCLQWLDKQDKASVIYVSFGSTTSMTDEQITELALGLEKSEQRFIWVLRRADKSDVFGKCEESLLQLPEGFEERLHDRGIIVREWAPQLEILAHPSTGGFMSHCGWNSCIESMSMGVPIAAWPMHSEQPRNTILVTEMLKVGTVVRNWAHRSELVTSSTIQKAVITLMASKEGDKMRERAAKLGEAIQGSVSEDGPSRMEMDSFIAHISRSQASDV